jgi:hypothetical protein
MFLRRTITPAGCPAGDPGILVYNISLRWSSYLWVTFRL